MISEVIPPVIGDVWEGIAFSQVLTPTLVDLDDGTYEYKWELNAGLTTLKLSSSTAATPTLSADNPVVGIAYLNLTVTDSSGHSVEMEETEIDVGESA
ncbi:hypothetical protein ACEF96_003139 [Salmonella enterica]|nr:hypothetical protein [Salmonella enterica]